MQIWFVIISSQKYIFLKIESKSFAFINRFQLPPVVLNDMVEPFIDISAGGQHLIGAVNGFVAVWAVTINGLLLYR